MATSAWPGGKDNLTPIDLASTAMDVVGEEHDEKHELTEDFINKAQDDLGTTTPAAGSLRYKLQNTAGRVGREYESFIFICMLSNYYLLILYFL